MEIIDDELKRLSKLFSLKSNALDINELFSEGIIKITNSITFEDIQLLIMISKKMKLNYIYVKDEAISQIIMLLGMINNAKVIIDDVELYRFLKIDNYVEYGTKDNLTDSSDVEVYQVLYNFKDLINRFKTKYNSVINSYDNVEFVYVDNMSKESLKDPSTRTISSKNLKEKDNIINMIINEVKSLNLSPLEKYIYLYNIVKMFKLYNPESDLDSAFISRQSEFILFNNYMVCVGYCDLLVELIDELNDPNLKATNYMCMMKENEDDAHLRCMVKINDAKYGINGTYISDPTNDRIKEHTDQNAYYHLLLTKQQVDLIDLYFNDEVLPDATDILFSSNSRFDSKSIPNISWSIAHYINWKLNKSNMPIKSCKLANRLDLEQEEVPKDKIEQAIRVVYESIYLPTNKSIFSKYSERKNRKNYEEFIEEIIINDRARDEKIGNLLKK